MEGHGPDHKRDVGDKAGFCSPSMSAAKSAICNRIMTMNHYMLWLMGVKGPSDVYLAKGIIACMAVGFAPSTQFESHSLIEQAGAATGAADTTRHSGPWVTNGFVLQNQSGKPTIASCHTASILRVKPDKVRGVFEGLLLAETTYQVYTIYHGFLMNRLDIQWVGCNDVSLGVVNRLSALLFADVVDAAVRTDDGRKLLLDIDTSLYYSSREVLQRTLERSYDGAASRPRGQAASDLGSSSSTARPARVSSLVSLVQSGGVSAGDGQQLWRKGRGSQARDWDSFAKTVPGIRELLVESVLNTLDTRQSTGEEPWGHKKRFWAEVCQQVCVGARDLAREAQIEAYLPSATECNKRYDHPSLWVAIY